MTTLDIRQVPAAKAREVLRLTMALPGQSAGDIEAQVSAMINHARALSLEFGGQWLAFDGGRVVAACSCIESPGRTGVLFLPAYGLTGGSDAALESLLVCVADDLSSRNVRLAQCLLNLDDRHNERMLLRAEFRPVAELIYLEQSVLDGSAGQATEPLDLTWDDYNPSIHRDFAELIQATYRGSQDCPALTGLRDIEDTIAGHRSVGYFHAQFWRMARVGGVPAGCILLGENPLRSVLEVAYMGVHPDYRGRGLGRALVHEASRLAYHERFEKVTLAVDSANAPARRLYGSTGFVETMRRRAMIRALDSSPRVR